MILSKKYQKCIALVCCLIIQKKTHLYMKMFLLGNLSKIHGNCKFENERTKKSATDDDFNLLWYFQCFISALVSPLENITDPFIIRTILYDLSSN